MPTARCESSCLFAPPSSSKFGMAIYCVSETTRRNGPDSHHPDKHAWRDGISGKTRAEQSPFDRRLARLASALVVVIGITLILAPDPIETGIGVSLLLVGGIAFILAHFRSKVRHEPQIEELVTQPNEALGRDLRARPAGDLKALFRLQSARPPVSAIVGTRSRRPGPSWERWFVI